MGSFEGFPLTVKFSSEWSSDGCGDNTANYGELKHLKEGLIPNFSLFIRLSCKKVSNKAGKKEMCWSSSQNLTFSYFAYNEKWINMIY